VLLVGYDSRFSRNVRTSVNARHELHAAGAAILACDETILSSDETRWEEWHRETVEAESYSRRLGRRIREGYEAKFPRHGDQGGTTPLGFCRRSDPPHLLEIDANTIGQAVSLFEHYATGQHSFDSLAAEAGMAPERVREVLNAPIFNGYFCRGKRSREEERRAAPRRANPPVSDQLWDRVQAVRRAKTRGGGRTTQSGPTL
jgi:DNA invertase Pin-like site-specific DNA recombinase